MTHIGKLCVEVHWWSQVVRRMDKRGDVCGVNCWISVMRICGHQWYGSWGLIKGVFGLMGGLCHQ